MKALIVPQTRRRLKLVALSRLEADANQAIDIAKRAWYQFIIIADKIKASGLWRLKAKSWKAYVLATWGFKNTSRLSQFRKALPYQKILEAGNGHVSEAHIRYLSLHVAVEHPLMTEAFALGNKVAASNGRAPTPAIYKRSLDVLEVVGKTGGVMQVGEQTFVISNENQAIAAVKASLELAKLVGREGNNRKPVEVIAKRQRDGSYALISKDGGSLPDSFTFKAYLKG